MPRVTHFELPADDVEKLLKFYTDVFGWTAAEFPGGLAPYWLLKTGSDDQPGIDGGLLKRFEPGHRLSVHLEVPDIDVAILSLKLAGGTLVTKKITIPGLGWLVYFRDTEQNILGMMQTDENAK